MTDDKVSVIVWRRIGWVWWRVGSGGAQKRRKNTYFGGPKNGFRGRQVGAFSVFGLGVYRNPVHFWAKKGLKIRKCADLGVDVIQPRSCSVSGGSWGSVLMAILPIDT